MPGSNRHPEYGDTPVPILPPGWEARVKGRSIGSVSKPSMRCILK